ncbi:hypothetical protein JCM5350_000011 [Sporobolomyces pararoseus]
MQALLLSPATTFLSSPDSSSSLSPSTPALPSLDFLNQIDDEPQTLHEDLEDTEDGGDTYSRGVDTPTHARRNRVHSNTTGQQQTRLSASKEEAVIVARRSSIPPVPLTTPRIPSNLRYAFNAPPSSADQSTTTSLSSSSRPPSPNFPSTAHPVQSGEDGVIEEDSHALIQFDQSQTQLPPHVPSLSPNTSSTSTAPIGTFVVNSTKINGDVGGEGGENEQLAAAIRAFKGPPQSAGLFGGSSEDDASNDSNNGHRSGAGAIARGGKGNGLLSLFEPISPPNHVSLPKSTIPAPSLDSFSFSPPLASAIPTSTSTPVASSSSSGSNPSVATPSFMYDHSQSSELTPLAIPPLVPTQTPRPFSFTPTPGAGGAINSARTPSANGGQGNIEEMMTRGLNERKLEKKFLKRSTTTTAPISSVPEPNDLESNSVMSSASNTTARPAAPVQATPFSIADLIDSLPSSVPQSHSSSTLVGGGGLADYSTTQEFQSALSHSRDQTQSRAYPPTLQQQQGAEWSSDGDEEAYDLPQNEEDETTTQDEEEGEDREDETDRIEGEGENGGGFVPPSTMTLEQLKENGFVSSSDEEEDDEDGDNEGGDSEDQEQLNSVHQNSGGQGRHLGYSGSSSSPEEDEDQVNTTSFSQNSRRLRRRGPLQSSSNAPSSIHSSFAAPSLPLPLPEPPTLTFDHLPPSPSNSLSYRSRSRSRSPSPPRRASPNHHHLAPIASPLKLFQSTYDTYTRQHLNEIVDLVDSTTLNPNEQQGREEGDSSEEGFLGEEGRRRSCKRIKLSPPREYEEEEESAQEDEQTIRFEEEGEERSREGEQSWTRGQTSRRSQTYTEEGTPIRSSTTMISSKKGRTPRTSSERRRRRDSTRKSFGGTPSSRRESFAVVIEEEAADESHLNRQERVKDRREEAMELMEKIRKRSEERENRRKLDQPVSVFSSYLAGTCTDSENTEQSTTSSPRLRSPPKVALLSPRPRSPIPPSQLASESPPPLPHLAAAASASIRSVLGSPAPSYQTRSPRVVASPALVPTPNKTIGLGFEKKFPSSIVKGLENGGSIGKRNLSKPPMATSANETQSSSENRPSPFLDAVPPSPAGVTSTTPGHKRKSSLTTIHPSSVDAQRLLASVGSSAQAKGMVFDDQLGRWIRTPRKRIVSKGSSDLVEETVPEVEEEEEEEEEDPFKDFSELQSPPQVRQSPTIVVASPRQQEQLSIPSPIDVSDVSPASTLSRADLDKLPHPGDGSGSLKSHHFDLSGLGISKGTPPLLAPPSKKSEPIKSPEGACYFDSHPPESTVLGETPLLRLEEEEEDSATWGREEAERRLGEARLEKETAEVPQCSRSPPTPAVISRSGSAPPPKASPATPAHIQHSHSAPPSTSTPFPRSALKPSRAQTDPTNFYSSSTPIRASSEEPKLPRSVSFSDGKLQGKIENPVVGFGKWKGSRLKYEVSKAARSSSIDMSAPGGGGFGDLEMDEDADAVEESQRDWEQGKTGAEDDDTPRATRTRSTAREQEISETSLVLSSFDSVSPANPRSANSSRSRTFSRTPGSRNATFLTECSFGVSHDRLLQFITDVEPFEPDWEGLRSIDLSGKKAESVVRMKEFLPKLDEVNLNNNEISYLTGIPATLRTLLIASNRLTSLTSFHHLQNLERLDLSNNQLDSVEHLSALRHLRDLKADGNQISSIEGLGGLDGLIRLSLKGNQLRGEIDFTETKWSRLETLVISRNNVSSVRGLETLESLVSLNLDHNSLTEFAPKAPSSRLRILRLCNNPISHLDVSFASRLRTLYIDTARLGTVEGTEQLGKLENFSLRDQSGEALTLAMPPIRDVKRLYLSGNPLPLSFPSEKFFNLTYLELAMCQLTSLPADIASLVPNVRTLNLDFNFLESLEPLTGLTRLSKLSVVGARLMKVRPVVHVLGSLVELESLDMRMNPITLAFYPPLGPSTETLLPSHREHQILHPDSLPAPPSSSAALTSTSTPAPPDFVALDTKFRKALPDEWYFKRNAYRAALMHAVPTLIKLDGIDCTRERKKLRKVVEKLKDRA